MTIVGSDTISVAPTVDDNKSLGVDLSDSLFDYDMLLNDAEKEQIPLENRHNELFESLFKDDLENRVNNSSESSSGSSASPSSIIGRPKIMQWGPHSGNGSTTIVTVMLEHTGEVAAMKVVFGSLSVETAQQQHMLDTRTENGSAWITLAATVPPLSETLSESNKVQLSICLFDQNDPDLAVDTWELGKFTYCDVSPVKGTDGSRKRALSCEDGSPQKKKTFDIKQEEDTEDDVSSQLLRLLAPYDPLMMTSSEESSGTPVSYSSQNFINTNQWVSPTVSNNPASSQNYTSQPESSNPVNYFPNPVTNIMLQQGLLNKNRQDPVFPMMPNQNDYMLPKQDMYRAFLEIQQRQLHQNYMTQQYHSQLIPQSTENYMNTNAYNSNSNIALYNLTEQQKQDQLCRLQQKRQQNIMNQYNHSVSSTPTARRASAPVSSHTIATSNSCALNKAHLKMNGNLMDMIVNWTVPEWQSGRRLVRFWRNTTNGADGTLSGVECGFELMDQQLYHQRRMRENVAAVAAAAAAAAAVSSSPSSATSNTFKPTTPIVVSCIYWRERNDYFITSVDCIYLLESIIGIRFTVEEKNRIRRNLEGFRPLTVSKCKSECADFFKLIMSFPHPKPRNIEKDVKVFSWKTLPHALRKIIRKYTPSYIATMSLEQNQQTVPQIRSVSTGNIYLPMADTVTGGPNTNQTLQQQQRNLL